MKQCLINDFKKLYNEKTHLLYFSPGRVNLIGEHIDYNGGFVMPAAISYGTYGAVSLREDNNVYVYSKGFSKEVVSFSLNKLSEKDLDNSWINYIKGVFYLMKDAGYKINKGINLLITSTMPTSAGLSSSSSLELLIIYILNDLFNLKLSKVEMAKLGKKVENDYIGVNSGIMDQFAIANSKKDYAMILNTETLDFEYVPIELKDEQLIIVNTNKKRGLTDSKYNERFNECRKALSLLQNKYNIKNLSSLSVNDLEDIKKYLNNETLYKRVKHVITEQNRTILSGKALKANDLETFGKLMNESHISLRDDYDVTGIELDTLFLESIKQNVIGARMTGAGFGGCLIALVKNDKVNDYISNVKKAYLSKIGYEPSFYKVEPSSGTSKY